MLTGAHWSKGLDGATTAGLDTCHRTGEDHQGFGVRQLGQSIHATWSRLQSRGHVRPIGSSDRQQLQERRGDSMVHWAEGRSSWGTRDDVIENSYAHSDCAERVFRR